MLTPAYRESRAQRTAQVPMWKRRGALALESGVAHLRALPDIDLAHGVGEPAARMQRNIVFDHRAPAAAADHDHDARIRRRRRRARDEQQMDRALGGRIAADADDGSVAQPGGIDCREHIVLYGGDLSKAVAHHELVAVGILYERADFYACFRERHGKLRDIDAVDEDQTRPGLGYGAWLERVHARLHPVRAATSKVL